MRNFCCLIIFTIFYTSFNATASTLLYLQGDVQHRYSMPDGIIYSDSDGVFNAKTIIWSPVMGLPVGHTIEVDYFDNNSTLSVPTWGFEFSAPDAESLQVQKYDNIYRNPFNIHRGLHEAGFALSSGHTGCNGVGGSFEILEVVITNNILSSFAADFTFICEPGDSRFQVLIGGGFNEEDHSFTPPIYRDAELYGSIRINSDIPLSLVPVPPSIVLFFTGALMLFRIKHNNSFNPDVAQTAPPG